MFHIHFHNRVIIDEETDQVKACRCGDIRHYVNTLHRYTEHRTPEENQKIADRMLRDGAKIVDKMKYRSI